MNVRDACYALAKDVIQHPDRRTIQKIITALSAATLDNSDRSHFGYLARKQQAQFLGFLLVDREREGVFKNVPPPVPPLEPDERLLLAAAHENLLMIDERCLEAGTDLPEEIRVLLDSYGHHRYAAMGHASRISLFGSGSLEDVATAFASHPGWSAIRQGLRAAKVDDAAMRSIAGLVLGVEKALREAGPLVLPDAIAEIYRALVQRPEVKPPFQVAFGIVSIRTSLESVNQMTYQAVLQDRLAILSDENLIQYGGGRRHLAGIGHEVTYQPSAAASYIEPGDVCLLRPDQSLTDSATPCLAGGVRFSMSQDFGSEFHAELWELDDSLNRYGPLLRMVT